MTTPDLQLLQAIGELKARVKSHPTGRVYLEVHTLGGMTVEHRIQAERMTEEELARVMRERPCRREAEVEARKGRRR